MFTLFFSPGSCSRASHIVLEESGLPYKAQRVNFAEGEQRSEAFLTINPKGRVPALVTASGVLTETPAILAFIAQMAPEKKLAPLDDPFEFARMQSFNAFISSTVHVAHAHGRRGSRWANEESSFADMKAKVPQTMTECFELIEKGLLHGPWVLGTAYSVADPYLFVMSGWLESDGVDIARFPRVHDHFKRMSARPAVQKVLVAEKA
ncbi:glutathione S-transferase family protein [Rhizobium sp. RM]|uniref:glutathione S-transferase family protein n=1 Tax=Rhizobium/Agrobacterium group TaxID=227290 RepID=UPI00110E8A8A|nr:glutathione S-transferase family protein [Rhizobium sp. RM]NWJ25119.1 glutathione S-transferase family protein [Rhizobium sp. RM]TMV16888.1 glutathione S-transferase family protein [Rhizobium sp. Td3]